MTAQDILGLEPAAACRHEDLSSQHRRRLLGGGTDFLGFRIEATGSEEKPPNVGTRHAAKYSHNCRRRSHQPARSLVAELSAFADFALSNLDGDSDGAASCLSAAQCSSGATRIAGSCGIYCGLR